METATKETKETKKPIEALYPLEWEERAFREVLRNFKMVWQGKSDRFESLSHANESIALGKTCLPNLTSGSSGLVALYDDIFDQLIFHEPYLYRMLAYISTNPDDLQGRQTFYETYLSTVNFEAYHDLLSIDVLVDSDLAKGHRLSGIPLHSCFVGKVLAYLLMTTNHYRLVDQAKLSGATESIAELRIKRGEQQTSDGMVSDYSPLFKCTKSTNGRTYTFEVFNLEDFDPKRFSQYADDILCAYYIKANRDRRQDLYFGSVPYSSRNTDFDAASAARYQFILKYGEQRTTIPFQLLPKWYKFMRLEAHKRSLRVETVMAVFAEIIHKWDESRGPATNYLSQYLQYETRHAFTALIRDKEKRSSENSLDEVITPKKADGTEDEANPLPLMVEGENQEKLADVIPDPSDDHDGIVAEIMDRTMSDQRLVAILQAQEDGISMTPAERKYKERAVESLRQRYDALKGHKPKA